MEIIRISISRLFHSEFLTLLKKIKDIITLYNPNNNATIAAKATVVSNEIPALENALGVENGSLFTDAMQEQDHKRDDLLVGLKEVLSGQCKNPDDNFSKPAKTLLHITDSFGVMASDNSDSETSKIDAFIKEFFTVPENLTALVTLGLKKWVDTLQTANNDYKDLAAKRANEEANEAPASFKTLRVQATNDYEALAKTINSLAYTDTNNTFDKLIKEINAVLDEFAQKIAIRKGIKAAAKQKKKDGA